MNSLSLRGNFLTVSRGRKRDSNNVDQSLTNIMQNETPNTFIELKILPLIYKNCTTSVLLMLENARLRCSIADYKAILKHLCEVLDYSSYRARSLRLASIRADMRSGSARRQRLSERSTAMPSTTDAENYHLAILYYVASICHKLNINDSEVWHSLLKNKLTQTPKFYRYLLSHNIQIPLIDWTSINSTFLPRRQRRQLWTPKMNMNLIRVSMRSKMGCMNVLTSSDFSSIANWEKLMYYLRMYEQEFRLTDKPSVVFP
ncbi:unnamed protein product, partial [Didymodactylos carnosus]